MRCKQRHWDENKDNEMWTKTMRFEQRQWDYKQRQCDVNKGNEM